MLLQDYNIYVQSINYPTVPVGQERLRITPTPGHTKEYRDELVDALEEVWTRLEIKRTSEWAADGGFIGVGEKDNVQEPLWTDRQLGVEQAAREILAAGRASGNFTETLLAKEAGRPSPIAGAA